MTNCTVFCPYCLRTVKVTSKQHYELHTEKCKNHRENEMLDILEVEPSRKFSSVVYQAPNTRAVKLDTRICPETLRPEWCYWDDGLAEWITLAYIDPKTRQVEIQATLDIMEVS